MFEESQGEGILPKETKRRSQNYRTTTKVPSECNEESQAESTEPHASPTENRALPAEAADKPLSKVKGHGRLPHTAYSNATEL